MFNEEIKAIKRATDSILLRYEQYVVELQQSTSFYVLAML